MAHTTANGIEICYDTFGDSGSPALLLIAGLSAQMIFWEEPLCEQLAAKGLFVIRFDNRDVGLSTRFDQAGIPDMQAVAQGKPVQAPYSLDDMADDAVGLLDALGIDKAHLCGVSMGAMIALNIGYRHPARVLSLIPIMGSTGSPALSQPKPEALEILVTPAPVLRQPFIDYAAKVWRAFSGGTEFDPQAVRNQAARNYDRAFYPAGVVRQHAAIIANGETTQRLAGITAPTLVIHGARDPLLPLDHGMAVAKAVNGAQMLVIEAMGHCLPQRVWPQIVDAIAGHTTQAAGSTKTGSVKKDG
jgi:pimeloyl-ACP methyl ester carboxylesterase